MSARPAHIPDMPSRGTTGPHGTDARHRTPDGHTRTRDRMLPRLANIDIEMKPATPPVRQPHTHRATRQRAAGGRRERATGNAPGRPPHTHGETRQPRRHGPTDDVRTPPATPPVRQPQATWTRATAVLGNVAREQHHQRPGRPHTHRPATAKPGGSRPQMGGRHGRPADARATRSQESAALRSARGDSARPPPCAPGGFVVAGRRATAASRRRVPSAHATDGRVTGAGSAGGRRGLRTARRRPRVRRARGPR